MVRVVCLYVLVFSGTGSLQKFGAALQRTNPSISSYPPWWVLPHPQPKLEPWISPSLHRGAGLRVVTGSQGCLDPSSRDLHAFLLGDHQLHSLHLCVYRGRLPSKAWRVNVPHNADSCVHSGVCSPCSCVSLHRHPNLWSLAPIRAWPLRRCDRPHAPASLHYS